MAERVTLWGRDIDEAPADLDDGLDVGGDHRHVRPSIDPRLGSASSTLTFKPAPRPWYRTGRGLVVLIAVITVAVVLSIVPMLLRGSAPASDEPTNAPPTTAEPVPTSAPTASDRNMPTPTSRPAPPPPPPAPPLPPPAQEAPVNVPQYEVPRSVPSQQAKPEIGVTRAPISVAPKPVTPRQPDVGRGGNTASDGNSAMPGRW